MCLPEQVGKVFVEFEDIESCKKAAAGLNQVKFDDRTVETDFSSPEIMVPCPSLRSHQYATFLLVLIRLVSREMTSTCLYIVHACLHAGKN
jgi:RNA recognition motif-containing protein